MGISVRSHHYLECTEYHSKMEGSRGGERLQQEEWEFDREQREREDKRTRGEEERGCSRMSGSLIDNREKERTKELEEERGCGGGVGV